MLKGFFVWVGWFRGFGFRCFVFFVVDGLIGDYIVDLVFWLFVFSIVYCLLFVVVICLYFLVVISFLGVGILFLLMWLFLGLR